jgi:hypothetical protein
MVDTPHPTLDHADPTDMSVGPKNHRTGVVDLAMLQSLAGQDDPAALWDGYRLVMVDECHHVAAETFETAIRDVPALCKQRDSPLQWSRRLDRDSTILRACGCRPAVSPASSASHCQRIGS